jgi:hypothetical protein
MELEAAREREQQQKAGAAPSGGAALASLTTLLLARKPTTTTATQKPVPSKPTRGAANTSAGLKPTTSLQRRVISAAEKRRVARNERLYAVNPWKITEEEVSGT